jgi:molecular chaperone DnaK (HSP70)
MPFCAQCGLDYPHLVNGQAFCVTGHLLYTFAAPGEVAAVGRSGERGKIRIPVRNTGAWDARIRAELEGPLLETGATISPSGAVDCPREKTVEFIVQVPPDAVKEGLQGVLKVQLDPGAHRLVAQQPRVQNNLPSVPLRLDIARARIVVEPPSLEFSHGQGARVLKVRNTGTDNCQVNVDLEQSSRELDVSGSVFPCDVGTAPHELPVSVLWNRLPPDQGEVRLNLVLRASDPSSPPITVPVVAKNQSQNALKVPIGIDFGTSKTVVAGVPPHVVGQMAEPLKIQGREMVPTVVAVKRTDPETRYWGSAADGLSASTRHYALIRSVKTELASGTTYEIQRYDEETGTLKPVAVYTPEEIAGFYMRELLTEARRELAKLYNDETVEIGTVVLTHPANWTNAQRNATCEVFTSAGIAAERLETRNEARAAAMSALQQHAHTPNATLLVYDMGAGTLDATILLKTTGEDGIAKYEEDGAAVGEVDCAGDSFDQLIAGHLTDQLNTQYGTTFTFDTLLDASLETDERALGEQIRKAARDAKERLSRMEVVPVRQEVTLPGGEARVLDAQVTRGQFEGWVGDRLREVSKRVLDGVFQAAQKTKDHTQVDFVLMVGGSVQVPLVQSTVRGYFQGTETNVQVHLRPELAVGLGAAVMANRLAGLAGEPGSMAELDGGADKITYSVGLQTREGLFVPLVLAGSPCGESYVYERALTGTNSFNLQLLQYVGPKKDPGIHKNLPIVNPKEWELLSYAPMKIPPGLPTNLVAVIDVDVDNGGRLKVSVHWTTPDRGRKGEPVILVSRA